MNKSWNTKRIFIHFGLQNLVLCAASVVAIIVGNVINVLLPLSIGWFYEIALGDVGTKSKVLKNFPFSVQSISDYFFLFGILILVKGLFVFLEKYLTGILGERFSRDLRERVFASQLRHTLPVHRLKPVGKYLLRYSGDLLAIQQLIVKGILGFVGDLFFVGFAFVVLFLINSNLALIVFVGLLVSALIVIGLSSKVRLSAVERRNQRSILLGYVSSRMSAFYTIKSFNRENPETNGFLRRSKKLYDLGVHYLRISAFFHALLPVFFFSVVFAIFYYIAYVSENYSKIINMELFVFVLMLLYLQTSVKRLLKVNLTWQVGIVSLNKLLTLINLPEEKLSQADILNKVKPKIIFENVTFGYESGIPVLNEISFELLPGTITFLKGSHSAGKTTVIKLIQKIVEPDAGRIFFDEHPYNGLSAFEIRKNVTLVSPEVPLLGNTVFKAVSYSTSEDKRDKVKRMLSKLKIELAKDEDDNLNYKLDDSGQNISAGNRSKLQFVRAFLTSKRILLLDDVFKGLDTESIQLIVDELIRIKSKRTILITGNFLPDTLVPDQIIELHGN